MAGVRGAKSAMPMKAKAPTGMFSTNGSQKMDPKSTQHKAVMDSALCCTKGKVAPKKRDNMLKS